MRRGRHQYHHADAGRGSRPDHRPVRGDFGYWKAAGYVSGPLTERLSANLAVTALQDDGFVRNIFLNKDSGSRELLAARTKLVFDIDDASRLWLGLSYQDGRDNTNQSGQPLAGNSRGRRVPGSVTPSEPWTTATQFIPISKGESFAADLHYSREFAGFDLRAVLAYSEASQYNLTDSDNTSAAVSGNDTTFKASTYSFEAVLASSGEGAGTGRSAAISSRTNPCWIPSSRGRPILRVGKRPRPLRSSANWSSNR